MICKDIKNLIPLYYYGELEDEEFAAVREHLASCAACGKELESVERVLKGVTAPEAPDLPEEFWSQNAAESMRRVRKRPVSPPAAGSSMSRFSIPLWAGAAAAVILFLFIMRVDTGPEPHAVSERSAVEMPILNDIDLEDIEITLGIEGIEEKIDNLKDSPSLDDFDSGFARTLDKIENSIDGFFMEFELIGPWGIDENGSV